MSCFIARRMNCLILKGMKGPFLRYLETKATAESDVVLSQHLFSSLFLYQSIHTRSTSSIFNFSTSIVST